MNPEKVIIRKAVVDDAYGMAFARAHTRQTTYQGLIPEEGLQKILESMKKLRKWQKE